MPIYRKGNDQFPLAMKAFSQAAIGNPNYPKLDVSLSNLKKPVSELKDTPISGDQTATLKDLGKLPKDKILPKNVTDLNDYKIRKNK